MCPVCVTSISRTFFALSLVMNRFFIFRSSHYFPRPLFAFSIGWMEFPFAMFKTNEYLKFPILQKRFLNEFEMQFFFFLPTFPEWKLLFFPHIWVLSNTFQTRFNFLVPSCITFFWWQRESFSLFWWCWAIEKMQLLWHHPSLLLLKKVNLTA